MKKKVAGFVTLLTIWLTFVSMFATFSVNAESSYVAGAFRETTYQRVLTNWLSKYAVVDIDEQVITPDFLLNADILSHYNEEYGKQVLTPAIDETITYEVTVPSTGLYQIGFDYYYNTAFSAKPSIDVTINDEVQFNELNELDLDVEWENVARAENDRYNQYGDELLPYSQAILKWYHSYLEDDLSAQTTAYYVLLTAGLNSIKITANVDDLYFGQMYLGQQDGFPSYETYYDSAKGPINSNETITIQAEQFYSKNDIEVKSGYYKSVAMTPTNYKSSVLNMLDGESTSRGGTKTTYKFTVDVAGYYALSLKYLQNSLTGLAVARNIYIDGVIPFAELQGYLFASTSKWTVHTLGGEEPYYIYLTAGAHEIALEATTSPVNSVIDRLYTIMDQINSIGLSVKSITGSSSDTQIDWNIVKYLPTLVDDLNACSSALTEIYDYINALDPTSRRASEVSSLTIAATQLTRLAKHPNKVQNRLGELCDGSGSAYQLIGTVIGTLVKEDMDIDYLAFHGTDVELPRANGNIFQRIWFGIKSFFYSFFDQRYSLTTNQEEGTLQVWVATSSLYVNILQDMVDSTFTKDTGIKVRLNILPNSQKIVLNNATGTNPDVVLSIDSWEPYNYALRGMLVDLSEYEGFDEIASRIYGSNFTPLIYDEGVYGIPETQGMQLLFYRTDILDFLGLTAPDTWEDVLKMLPILQSYQMNYYHPLGYDSAYKGFGYTSQFFYQFGAEIYSTNGFTTVLNQEKAVEAIQFMTDLFNIYNLPQQVSSFFEHFRSGTLPIGLAGIDMYLQLKYACPELAGQWDVLPVPGVYNSETDEVERWTTTYGKCSIMFEQSDMKDEAWDFLKWWHSTDTQTDYLLNIKMYLGERYLIVPANIDSLSASCWDATIKNQVVSQAEWSRIPAITPGSYVIEREISNIWNKIVIDKDNVRVAINESIAKINRELARKFEEFHYLENGVIIKDYTVPTNDNLELWVRGREHE